MSATLQLQHVRLQERAALPYHMAHKSLEVVPDLVLHRPRAMMSRKENEHPN